MTYHIGLNGKPSICKAKQGNCPYESISPHFDTVEKAQLYSDNLNAFISKNITTETELSKHCKINEIIESQDMEVRLKNIKKKEENILKQAEEKKLWKELVKNVHLKNLLWANFKRMTRFIEL